MFRGCELVYLLLDKRVGDGGGNFLSIRRVMYILHE